MQKRFTEQDTENFYNGEDAVYRSFWDQEGSLHWGLFDEATGDDFLKACANLNDIMARKARIGGASRVLDLGCGNGTTSTWLSRSCGCRVVGIDLSAVRIGNARQALREQPEKVRADVAFKKASATELPFDTGAFTHVWSQACIYHVHDKQRALQESYRVLTPGGLMVFDDLTRPKAHISDSARQYVYDRLLFDTDFTFHSYQDALRSAGFRVLEAHDISPHLKKTYQCLARITAEKGDEHQGKYRDLTFAYHQMTQAVDNGELGWGLYLCQK